MGLILHIETSTSICSVSIAEDGILRNEISGSALNDHMSHLTLLIKDLLFSSSILYRQLDAIAVSAGPGSYTGLRIGVSTAKGICHALQIPLLAASSLLSMVEGAKSINKEPGLLYCPLIDARRMEVYTLIVNDLGVIYSPQQAFVFEVPAFTELLDSHRILFFGSGLPKAKDLLQHPNARFLDAFNPLSSNMSALADTLFQKKMFCNLAHFEPDYIKEVYIIKK